MQLAILHYHLNRGGVTRVIENLCRGLALLPPPQHPQKVCLFHGGRCDGWDDALAAALPYPLRQIAVPGLDYDQLNETKSGVPTGDSGRLGTDLEQALRRADFSQQATVLHIHNHSLGKNKHLPLAVEQLGSSGWRLLLQPHDFAEDFRAENYRSLLSVFDGRPQLARALYPQAEHIHYATLNRRDFRILDRAGIDSARLHRLPNSVHALEPADRKLARRKLNELGIGNDTAYLLYPVRGIRRKNLGELLLWSAMFPEVQFAVTLAPKNPREATAYNLWVDLVAELGLRILFASGETLSLAENYSAADAVITTSVAEGFGLVFLEAALAGLPLFGRDLPEITEDFREVGISFPGLAATISIPCSPETGLHADQVANLHREHFQTQLRHYGIRRSITTPSTEPPLADSCPDFGQLDRNAQRLIIAAVARDPTLRTLLYQQNAGFQRFSDWLTKRDSDRSIDGNRKLIEEVFSLRAVGQRYRSLLQKILDSSTGNWQPNSAHGESILAQFLRPERLFPIRYES